MKQNFIFIFFVLSSLCFAQSPFSLSISKNKVSICSGGSEFFLNAAKKSSMVYIKDYGYINTFTFMPKPLPYKSYAFRLGDINNIQVLKDTDSVKRLKIPLVYGGKIDNVDFYMILEAHKDIPALIIDYAVDNKRVDNLFFRSFFNLVIPTGGAVSYMMDYDASVKFPVNPKRAYLPESQWQIALGANGKGVGFFSLSKTRIYTFKHPKYTRLNYLGVRSVFGVSAESQGFASRLVVFPADNHTQAKAVYQKIVKFKDVKIYKKTTSPQALNPFANKNVIKIKKLGKAPIIDGTLEKVWKEAVGAVQFWKNAKAGSPTQKTQAFLAYDNQNLYIAFECFDDNMPATKECKKMPWKGDSVEIYFSPDGDNNVFQLVANLGGAVFTRKIVFSGDSQSVGEKWQPQNLLCKVKKLADKWCVELAVPLKEIGLTADKEGISRINLYRNQYSRKERSAFSPTRVPNMFAVPERFGTLVFGKYPYVKMFSENLKSTRQELDRITGLVKNAKIRKSLKPLLEEFSKLGQNLHKDMVLNDFILQVSKAEALKEKVNEKIYELTPVVVWAKNPMRNLKQFAIPALGKSRDKLELTAFLNEHEYAAFAISNLTKQAKTFHVGFTPLYNTSNKKLMLSPDKIKFREAVFVKPENLYPIPDAMPLMNQINSFTLAGRKTHEIWLELNSRNIVPGTYKGFVFIEEIIGKICKRMPVSITVLPVFLPDEKPFIMHYMCGGGASKKNLDMISEYYGNVVSGPVHAISKSTLAGNRREAAVMQALKKRGIKSYSAWTQKILPENKFEQRLKSFAEKLAYLKKQGITTEDFSMRHLDEARPEEIDVVCKRIQRVQKAIPGIRFSPTLGGHSNSDVARKYAKLVYDFILYGPEGTSLVNNKEIMKIVSGGNRKVWFYCNLLPQKTSDLFKVIRKTAWAVKALRKDGLAGGGLWGFTFSGMNLHNPKANFSMVYYNFLQDIKYARTMKTHIPSRRLLVFRDGLDDVMGILRLEEILKNDKLLSSEQKRQLAKLITAFNRILCYSNDINDIYKFRHRLGRVLPQILPVQGTGVINNVNISVKDNQGNVNINYKAGRKLMPFVYYNNTSLTREQDYMKMGRKVSESPSVDLYELGIGDYKFMVGGIDEDGRVFIDRKKYDVIVEHTVE